MPGRAGVNAILTLAILAILAGVGLFTATAVALAGRTLVRAPLPARTRGAANALCALRGVANVIWAFLWRLAVAG